MLAQWMAKKGAKHLILVGRSPLTEEQKPVVAAIEQTGAQVYSLQADIGNPDEVLKLAQRIQTELPPLKGIVHISGWFDLYGTGKYYGTGGVELKIFTDS